MELNLNNASDPWNRALLLNNLQIPFLTHQWHTLWFKTLGTGWQSLLLSINTSIASFAVKDDQAILSGGYETADYLDIIGPDQEKKQVWEKCISLLKGRGIKNLELRNIPENSATVEFLKEQYTLEQEDTTPIIELPDSWDGYQQTLDRKSRHELRRKMRKFEMTFPETSLVVSENVEKDIHQLLRLMKLNTQKAEFFSTAMEDYFVKTAINFKEDCVLLYIKMGMKIASAVLAFKNKSSLLLYNSGFDETNFTGSGFYLKAASIKYAIEQKYKTYNFLQGNERYKYELGGKDFGVYKASLVL